MSLSDTPTAAPTFPPPSGMEQLKALLGDLARPVSLVMLAAACAIGLLLARVPADKLGLALTALGAMYGFKSLEKHGEAKAQAATAVGVAQAQAGGTK